MKRKIGIFLIALITMLMLVGWDKKEVKLLNSSKLIDLDKAIALAKPGGMSGESEKDSESTSDNDAPEEADETEVERNAANSSKDETNRVIVITIRDEEISYSQGNNAPKSISVEELGSRIRLDYTSESQITIRDNYAESHVYKSVCRVLDELKSDFGLTYREAQGEGDE